MGASAARIHGYTLPPVFRLMSAACSERGRLGRSNPKTADDLGIVFDPLWLGGPMTNNHAPLGVPARSALNGITHLRNQELYAALTKREREIMSAVVVGKGDKEIADALAVSLKTVRTHLENVRRKLHLPNRAGAAALFAVHALLEHCDPSTRAAIARFLHQEEPATAKPVKQQDTRPLEREKKNLIISEAEQVLVFH